jgi:hypothetical protein
MTDEMDDRRLTSLLAACGSSDASAELRTRIIAAAPRQRAIGRAWRWLGGAGLGAVLAASCAAGVAAGLTLAPASLTRLVGGHASAPASSDINTLADPADDPAIG